MPLLDCVSHLLPLMAALPGWVEALVLWVMIFGEVVFFGGVALLWAAVGRQRFVDAFSWRRPAPAALAGAALLGLGLIPWVDILIALQGILFPGQSASIRAQTAAFLPFMLHQPVLLVLVLPVSAAVSEELLFRGPLQRALLRRLPVWAALGMGGFIFAAIHLDLTGLVARTALGILLGWVVLRTRSIVPAMLAHFVYDAALLGLGVQQVRSLGADRVLAMTAHPAAGMSPAEWIGWPLVGALLVAAGVWLCRRARAGEQSPMTPPVEADPAGGGVGQTGSGPEALPLSAETERPGIPAGVPVEGRVRQEKIQGE